MKAPERDALLKVLMARFDKNPHRHAGVAWADVRARLEANHEALRSLGEMEATGGEPDVVERDEEAGGFRFLDCAPESPSGRRSLCYDRAARESRKEHAPPASALEMATAMGIDLLTESQYRALQSLGPFDTKTSSWIATPPSIRSLGGALFCDRRYDHVFVYHNGAPSYYAGRGFRGTLIV